jgi:hypothetical protein
MVALSRLQFLWHRHGAADRGIKFLLTYEEWLQIWQDSGHYHERGCHRGQYVMARYNDRGPYAVGNVRIVTCTVNHKEGNKRNPKSEECKQKISRANKGKQARLGMMHSDETKAKMSAAKMGKRRTEEEKRKLSIALKGRPKSEITKQRMRAAAQRRRLKRRQALVLVRPITSKIPFVVTK